MHFWISLSLPVGAVIVLTPPDLLGISNSLYISFLHLASAIRIRSHARSFNAQPAQNGAISSIAFVRVFKSFISIGRQLSKTGQRGFYEDVREDTYSSRQGQPQGKTVH